MAATLTTQTLQDGERNVVIKGTIAGDGLGELTDGVLVDVSALLNAPSTVKIRRIEYATTGMSLLVEWDATADVLVKNIPADHSDTFDFSKIGGLKNNAGAGVTGDITVTTIGEAANTYATITLWGQKS